MPLTEYEIFHSLWSVVPPPKNIKCKRGILKADLINDLIEKIGFPYMGSSIVIDLQNIIGVNAVGLLGLTLILVELLSQGISTLVYTPVNQQFLDYINSEDIQRLNEIIGKTAINSRIIWRTSQLD
jgi:hypothetical protein